MRQRTERQLALEDWVARSEVGQKQSRAGKTQSSQGKGAGGLSGRKQHDLYLIWASMRNRCRSPSNKSYAYYGGRGITICERWNDFYIFASDMGPRPSRKHKIDRIDNNGNYEPGNCRWATQAEQNKNSRRVKLLTFEGESHSMADWERIKKLPRGVIHWRIGAGWSVERAISEPCA